MPASHRSLAVVGILVVCLVAGGCGSSDPVTAANFKKIKEGMPRSEVEQILGKPTEEFKVKEHSPLGITQCKWGNDKKSILVGFDKDDKVATCFGIRLD